MKAEEKGFAHATAGQKQIYGRAYETDAANKAYYRGYANGLRQRHPGQMIVKCNKDSTIFPAYPTNDQITCPTCARRYMLEDGIWQSDRPLTILEA